MTSIYSDLDRPPLSPLPLSRALVTPGSLWTHVEVLADVTSTNAWLSRRADDSDSAGRVVIAEHQTAGRGRLGRTWSAPARSALTMSVLVRPVGVDLARWPWLPLLSGLAVAVAVRTEAEVQTSLKWPNDVLVGDRKLAGVLVERVEAPGQDPAAVIGIGLNVSLRRHELPVETATSLALEEATTLDRTILARAVLRTLEGLLRDWQRHDDVAGVGLRAAYRAACSTLGREVVAELPGGKRYAGRAVDVDDSGRLVVAGSSGGRVLAAGDVVHMRGAGMTRFAAETTTGES